MIIQQNEYDAKKVSVILEYINTGSSKFYTVSVFIGKLNIHGVAYPEIDVEEAKDVYEELVKLVEKE